MRPPFTQTEITAHLICERRGWSFERDWLTLSDWERIDLLAMEHRRQEALRNLLKNIQYDKVETETDANGVQKMATKHYVHDYGAYIDILRELSGC